MGRSKDEEKLTVDSHGIHDTRESHDTVSIEGASHE